MIEYDATRGRKRVRLEVSDGTRFMARVFLYVFIALFVTAASEAGFGAIFFFIWPTPDNFGAFIALMVVSGIALLVLAFCMRFWLLRKAHSLLIPLLIYATVMGIFLASFSPFGFGYFAALLAFGVTCVVFGLMALIGSLVKKNVSVFLYLGMGILLGTLIIIPFNFLLRTIAPAESGWMPWVISLAIFIGIMLITIWDVWQVRKIAQVGNQSENLALYCAFTLYVDFIMIFIRIVQFIILLGLNRN